MLTHAHTHTQERTHTSQTRLINHKPEMREGIGIDTAGLSLTAGRGSRPGCESAPIQTDVAYLLLLQTGD